MILRQIYCEKGYENIRITKKPLSHRRIQEGREQLFHRRIQEERARGTRPPTF